MKATNLKLSSRLPRFALIVLLCVIGCTELLVRNIPFENLLNKSDLFHSGLYEYRVVRGNKFTIGDKSFSCKSSAIEFVPCTKLGPPGRQLSVVYRISSGIFSNTFIARKITVTSTDELLFIENEIENQYLLNSQFASRSYIFALFAILFSALCLFKSPSIQGAENDKSST